MNIGPLHWTAQSIDVDGLSEAIPEQGLTGWDFLTAGVIFVVAVAIAMAIKRVIRAVLKRAGTDEFLCDLVGRLVGYVIVAFGFVYALESLDVAIGPLLGALGIIGIALAFALQDILENFVAGIILQVRRPFGPGDEIVVDEHEGTVLAVDLRTVTLRTPDGETVRVPSAAVIKNSLANHTEHGRRRTTVEVGVAYDTDLEVASRAAVEAVRDLDMVLEFPSPEAYIYSFGPSSIDLAVRFWHEPSIADMWATRHLAATAIAAAFRDEDIQIPFPQQTLRVAEWPARPTDSADVAQSDVARNA